MIKEPEVFDPGSFRLRENTYKTRDSSVLQLEPGYAFKPARNRFTTSRKDRVRL
jgi:hypothetical protein